MHAPPFEIESLVARQRDQNLGNSVVLSPEDRDFKTVLQLNAKEPSAGEMVTIHLRSSRQSFVGPAELGVPNAIARVEYGHGGDSSGLLEVDWDHGTQLSIPAGSLRVSAAYPQDALAIDQIQCSAFVVRGARAAHSAGPRRTLTSQGLASASVPVPLGAKAVTVWDTLSPTPVLFLDHAGALIGFFLVLAFGNPPPGPVVVPPGAREVQLFGPHLARLVFDLEG